MFKPGQEIVAVKDHSQGAFKKGDVFIVKGIGTPGCNCHSFVVDIGKPCSGRVITCIRCKGSFKNDSGIHWFSSACFAPLSRKESDTAIAETELVLQN